MTTLVKTPTREEKGTDIPHCNNKRTQISKAYRLENGQERSPHHVFRFEKVW